MVQMADSACAVLAAGRNISLVLLVLIAVATKSNAANVEEEKCGLWLGPSPIKESEDHGWGHSMFTGKLIKKGSIVLGSGVLPEDKYNPKQYGDLFVPVYDWESFDMAEHALWDDDYMSDEDDDDDDDEVGAEDRKKAAEEVRRRIEKEIAEDDKDPPLFHQLWSGDIYKHEVLESEDSMRAFIPGLANICPCTFKDFNLVQDKRITYRDWRDIEGIGHDKSPPSEQAGSFSYLSNAFFRAARDIQPGEELVVECADNSDNFDPSDYDPVKFKPKEAGGYSICLDDKVEERLAEHSKNIAGGDHGGQRGLFAKKKLKQDEILTSTPLIPVHKEEMNMDREKYALMLEDAEAQGILQENLPPQKKQLLLNYMFGHPESSLMWLATAPLIHAVNHAPHDMPITPNAKIQWHHDKYTDAQASGKPLSRRQQFHHAELLEMDAREVVLKHGMGLMIDLVALRDIEEDEEILIDYGKAFDDAWIKHKEVWGKTIEAIRQSSADQKYRWKLQRKREREEKERDRRLGTVEAGHLHHQRHTENAMTAIPLSSYITSNDFNHLNMEQDIRTVSELRRKPYPSNLQTACYFETDWLSESDNADEDTDEMTYKSWYEQEDHFDYCLLPCVITERREFVEGEAAEVLKDAMDDDEGWLFPQQKREEKWGGSRTSKRYVAKLLDDHETNTSINYDCHIFKRFEYYYMDIPREGITFVDKIQSTDSWIDHAFRQPVGFPEEMVPKNWRDLSRRRGTRGGNRVKKPKPAEKEKTKKEVEEETTYQFSIKRWNEAGSRREKLEDILRKGGRPGSVRDDL